MTLAELDSPSAPATQTPDTSTEAQVTPDRDVLLFMKNNGYEDVDVPDAEDQAEGEDTGAPDAEPETLTKAEADARAADAARRTEERIKKEHAEAESQREATEAADKRAAERRAKKQGDARAWQQADANFKQWFGPILQERPELEQFVPQIKGLAYRQVGAEYTDLIAEIGDDVVGKGRKEAFRKDYETAFDGEDPLRGVITALVKHASDEKVDAAVKTATKGMKTKDEVALLLAKQKAELEKKFGGNAGSTPADGKAAPARSGPLTLEQSLNLPIDELRKMGY